VEAFPWNEASRYLWRDRDGIYGDDLQQRVHNPGIEEVLIAQRSPWQNPYVERVIGSIRRDMLDHVIVLDDQHLKRLLTEDVSYYHRFRTHLSLDTDCPKPRAIEPPEAGKVIEIAEVGGLQHHYERRAA
jgi:transposase InsO family protein